MNWRINVGLLKGRRKKCLSFVSSTSISKPLVPVGRLARPLQREDVKRVKPRERRGEWAGEEERWRGEGGRLWLDRRRRWRRDWNGIRGMSCNNRPPFDRPFRREAAPPLGSARFDSIVTLVDQIDHGTYLT